MFTGIIEATGRVVKTQNTRHGRFIVIKTDPKIARRVPEGGSVSVDGVCLTRLPFCHPEERSDEGSRTNVRGSHTREILPPPRRGQNDKPFLCFELMDSTLKRTTLGARRVGDAVNVEPAMLAGQPIGGHLISGHVDGVGVIENVECRMKNEKVLRIKVPARLARYLVAQGSVGVNGVSLTIVEVTKDTFSVALTSYTLTHTNLGDLAARDKVNIEVDLLVKYLEKFFAHYALRHHRRKL